VRKGTAGADDAAEMSLAALSQELVKARLAEADAQRKLRVAARYGHVFAVMSVLFLGIAALLSSVHTTSKESGIVHTCMYVLSILHPSEKVTAAAGAGLSVQGLRCGSIHQHDYACHGCRSDVDLRQRLLQRDERISQLKEELESKSRFSDDLKRRLSSSSTGSTARRAAFKPASSRPGCMAAPPEGLPGAAQSL
jgi:hypothetical protein